MYTGSPGPVTPAFKVQLKPLFNFKHIKTLPWPVAMLKLNYPSPLKKRKCRLIDFPSMFDGIPRLK